MGRFGAEKLPAFQTLYWRERANSTWRALQEAAQKALGGSTRCNALYDEDAPTGRTQD